MEKICNIVLFLIRYIGCVVFILLLFLMLPIVIAGFFIYGKGFFSVCDDAAKMVGDYIDTKINEVKEKL